MKYMKYKAVIKLYDIPKMDERELPEHFENYIKKYGIIEDQIELIEEGSEDINNAAHPLRQKAIDILEMISEKMGNEDMFDGEKWYDLEDSIVEILSKEK